MQFFLLLFLWPLISCQIFRGSSVPSEKNKIDHVVVIYLENHSFHNLFHGFPGADNEVSAEYHGQLDSKGHPYELLPPVKGRHAKIGDPRFTEALGNGPFEIDQFVGLSELIPDPTHEFFTHQVQIHQGLNEKFVANSAVGALPMGYFNMRKSYLWQLASDYVLADHFFQSAYGGSFLNHQWLIAARTPFYKDAPKNLIAEIGSEGLPIKSGSLTSDGFAVNSIQPFGAPYEAKEAAKQGILPALEYNNIGDLLSQKNISWAWFAGGWNDILKGKNEGGFQHHHQPFLYFKNYGPDTKGRQEHLKDEEDLFEAIRSNNLPQVSFFKPIGQENAHPGYTDMSSADAKLRKVIEALKKTSSWKNTFVIVTFDEHGGFWDPKTPPKKDRWGLGTRIPAVFILPGGKRHFVDHRVYETTSILSFLEKKYDLPPMNERDKKADPLSGVVEVNSK